MHKINTRFLSLLLIYGFFAVGMLMPTSKAYFTDSTTSDTNTFTTAESFTDEEIAPVTGSIVINEIMWAGTSAGIADEWIELRNMTNQPVDISGWIIEGAGTGSDPLILPSATISANGYFLIANYDENSESSILNITPDYVNNSLALTNSPSELLVFKNSSSQIIDQASGTGTWFAGSNEEPNKSMERNDIPSDGTVSGNWHSSSGQVNLDINSVDFGTPKAQNSTGL